MGCQFNSHQLEEEKVLRVESQKKFWARNFCHILIEVKSLKVAEPYLFQHKIAYGLSFTFD